MELNTIIHYLTTKESEEKIFLTSERSEQLIPMKLIQHLAIYDEVTIHVVRAELGSRREKEEEIITSMVIPQGSDMEYINEQTEEMNIRIAGWIGG